MKMTTIFCHPNQAAIKSPPRPALWERYQRGEAQGLSLFLGLVLLAGALLVMGTQIERSLPMAVYIVGGLLLAGLGFELERLARMSNRIKNLERHIRRVESTLNQSQRALTAFHSDRVHQNVLHTSTAPMAR